MLKITKYFFTLALLFYALPGWSHSLEQVAETKLDKTVFQDRYESEGIYRETAMSSSLNQLYIPLSIFVSNLNTSIREITGQIVSVGFDGGITRSPRLGNMEQVAVLENQMVAVRTGQALVGWDPKKEKEVWRKPLNDTTSSHFAFLTAPDSLLIQRETATNAVKEIEGGTGETLSVFTLSKDAGIVGVIGRNDYLLLSHGVYSRGNGQGDVKWKFSKIAPYKSYAQPLVKLRNGYFLLTEYISSTHPDEKLKRRTSVAVVTPDGKEVWSTVGYLYFVGQGEDTVYFEERTADRKTILNAVDTFTGAIRWKIVAEGEFNVSSLLSAVEKDGKLYTGYGNRLSVIDPANGKTLTTLDWNKRSNTKVLGVNRDTLMVLNQDAGEPYRQYLLRIKAN